MLAFELKNVSKHFVQQKRKIQALDNISLDIKSKKITGIIGQSGAGKSTLLRCLNLLETPDTGSILFEGTNLTHVSSKTLRIVRSHIGIIFQHFNLLIQSSVLENVRLPLILAHWPLSRANKQAELYLNHVGLLEYKDAYPNQLSGGQKQRVAIARALVNNTQVLLCDEATSALDVETVQEILQLLKHLNQSLGITIVLITHDIQVIKSICDHVIVLERGAIVEAATIETLFTDPQHSLTQKLIRSGATYKTPTTLAQSLTEKPKDDSKYVVIRLLFKGSVSEETIISKLIRVLNVDISILSGKIESIGSINMGVLFISFTLESQKLEAITNYLRNHSIEVALIGYY